MHTPRHRGALRASRFAVAGLVAGAVAFSTFSLASASPTSITSVRARVAQLQEELAAVQQKSEALAQHFDAVTARELALETQIRHTHTRIDRLKSQVRTLTHTVQGDAIRSYVYSAYDTATVSLFTDNAQQVNAQQAYQLVAIGNIDAAEAQLTGQERVLSAERHNLVAQRADVASARREAAALTQQNHALAVRTNEALASMSAHLRHLVEEAAIAAARAAAAAANAAAANANAGVASQLGGGSGILTGFGGSISGSASGSAAGQAAFSAAKTQIGVPYVWGGEERGVGFDCSGLTQWAWAQAGVSIPRTAAEQWAALPHVSLKALEPGDLLFYFNLDGDNQVDHVVMYGGSGPYGDQTTIAAAHTGTVVSLAPAFTLGLIGAARP